MTVCLCGLGYGSCSDLLIAVRIGIESEDSVAVVCVCSSFPKNAKSVNVELNCVTIACEKEVGHNLFTMISYCPLFKQAN